MGYGVEVTLEIRIVHGAVPFLEVFADLCKGIVGVSPRTESIRAVSKVLFEYGFQYQEHCHLCDPVPDSGDAKGSEFPIRFRDIYPQCRLGLVGLLSKFLTQVREKLIYSEWWRYLQRVRRRILGQLNDHWEFGWRGWWRYFQPSFRHVDRGQLSDFREFS